VILLCLLSCQSSSRRRKDRAVCRDLQMAAGAAPSTHSRRLHQAALQAGLSAQPASVVAADPSSDPNVASMDATSAEAAATASEAAVEFEEADEGPDTVDTGTMERAGDLFVAGTAAYPDPTGASRKVRECCIGMHGVSARVHSHVLNSSSSMEQHFELCLSSAAGTAAVPCSTSLSVCKCAPCSVSLVRRQPGSHDRVPRM